MKDFFLFLFLFLMFHNPNPKHFLQKRQHSFLTLFFGFINLFQFFYTYYSLLYISMKKIMALLAIIFSYTSSSYALKISSLMSSNSTTPAALSVHIKYNSTTIFQSNSTAVDPTIDTQEGETTMNLPNNPIEEKPIQKNQQKIATKPSIQKLQMTKNLPESQTTTTKPATADDLTNQPQKQQILVENKNKLSEEKQKPLETQSQTNNKKQKTKTVQNKTSSSVKFQPVPRNQQKAKTNSDEPNPHKKSLISNKTQLGMVTNPPLPVPGITLQQKPKQQKPAPPQEQLAKKEEKIQQTKNNIGVQWSKKDEEQFEEWKKNLIPVTDPKLQKEFNKQIQKQKQRRMKNKQKKDTKIE